MKRTLGIIALTSTLTLTACGALSSNEPPQAVEYPSMIEWYDAMDAEDSPVHCVQREAKSPPLINEAQYQVICREESGAEANIMTYASNDDLEDRLWSARQEPEWKDGEWVILRGPNWTVDCKTEPQCQNWQSGFGGEILKTDS